MDDTMKNRKKSVWDAKPIKEIDLELDEIIIILATIGLILRLMGVI